MWLHLKTLERPHDLLMESNRGLTCGNANALIPSEGLNQGNAKKHMVPTFVLRRACMRMIPCAVDMPCRALS